jgi:hypothetical protein
MIEDTLRQALAAEAESVEVSPDALPRIRARIARRRRWWVRFLPTGPALLAITGGTAVTAAAVATTVVLATAPHATPSAAPAGPGGPASSAARPTPATANLPVYYLGVTAGGLRLYREYEVVPVTGDDSVSRIRAALGAMIGGPLDPDYSSPWVGTAVNRVSVDGLNAQVDLHGLPNLDADTGRMALQQLVWTVTAVSNATAVRLLVDGGMVRTLWGVSGVDDVLLRAPRADVQAPVWLIDPQQGAVVGRTFDVYLSAAAPDGSVRIRVTSGGRLVEDQRVVLPASAPQQGEAHLKMSLDPGRYTVSAYLTDPAKDADSHDITVN